MRLYAFLSSSDETASHKIIISVVTCCYRLPTSCIVVRPMSCDVIVEKKNFPENFIVVLDETTLRDLYRISKRHSTIGFQPEKKTND